MLMIVAISYWVKKTGISMNKQIPARSANYSAGRDLPTL
jgi:hypothetical protein